ncbi:MAG: (((gamma-L-glutamylamino)ethyl phenoxymethyl)furan-2-yl)methanamine synthase [Methylobacteriaceae bacterium]|jgi:probable H4MPT-linked C1 transfer pathway protein|nr:(((gamma-L-glutamylamino)ethyl phenoxymethyl)furan-2-yl)methanamine synthase [Methylobacteriaceae bacterium]
MPTQSIIGWDIGGAHLKAARIENGRIVAALQVALPLWQGLHEAERAFDEAEARIGLADANAVTMTGELCDIFPTHAEGVATLAALAQRRLSRPLFYAGRGGFVPEDRVADHAADIASANWHASAAAVAAVHPNALFADVGSTTTDLIPIADGRVAALGYSDAERLAHGELVYAGVVRSYLFAGTTRAPFEGRWVNLMNEWFASMGDVYRILGDLPDGVDVMQTADNRDKSVESSRARLARMIGRDSGDADEASWHQLAQFFADQQARQIEENMQLVLSRGVIADDAPIVAAGIGRFVLARLAARFGRAFIAFESCFDATPECAGAVSDCAPAAAVAKLAADHFA